MIVITVNEDVFEHTEFIVSGDVGDPGREQGQQTLAQVTHDHRDTELPILLSLLIDDVAGWDVSHELRSRWLTLEQAAGIAEVLQRAVDAATSAATAVRRG